MDACIRYDRYNDHCEWLVPTVDSLLRWTSPLELTERENTCFHSSKRLLNSLPLQSLFAHITGEQVEAEEEEEEEEEEEVK